MPGTLNVFKVSSTKESTCLLDNVCAVVSVAKSIHKLKRLKTIFIDNFFMVKNGIKIDAN